MAAQAKQCVICGKVSRIDTQGSRTDTQAATKTTTMTSSGSSDSSLTTGSLMETGNSLIEFVSESQVIKWVSVDNLTPIIREACVYKCLHATNEPSLAVSALVDIQYNAATQMYGFLMHRADGDLDHYMTCCSFRDQWPDIEPLAPIDLMFSLLLSLDRIHIHGIVHRDIKPQNILLFRDTDNKKWCVCLADYGNSSIAYKYDSATRLSYTNPVCTELYAPPENFTGLLDENFDVFSLAATLVHFIMYDRRVRTLKHLTEDVNLYTVLQTGIRAVQNREFADMLVQMLHPNSKERPSVADLLSRPLFRGYISGNNQQQIVERNNLYPIADPNDSKIIRFGSFQMAEGTVDHLIGVSALFFSLRECSYRTIMRMLRTCRTSGTAAYLVTKHVNKKPYVTKKQGLWVIAALSVVFNSMEPDLYSPTALIDLVCKYIEKYLPEGVYKTPTYRAFSTKAIYSTIHHVLANQFQYDIPFEYGMSTYRAVIECSTEQKTTSPRTTDWFY